MKDCKKTEENQAKMLENDLDMRRVKR